MASSYELLKLLLQQATTTDDVNGNTKVALQSYFAQGTPMAPMELVQKLAGDGLADNPFHMLALMNAVCKTPAAETRLARALLPPARARAPAPRAHPRRR